MSRLAACPKCRNQFTLPELTGPATIACPFCGAHINIRMKGAAPPQAPPPAIVVQPAMAIARAMPVDDDEDENDEEEQRPRKKKTKKKKGAKNAANGSNETGMKAAMVGGILLLTVVSIVFAFWWFLKGDRGPGILVPTNTVPHKADNRNQHDGYFAKTAGADKFELAGRG